MGFDKIRRDILRDREKWRTIPGYRGFGSGPDNSQGLRLTPRIELGRVWIRMTIDDAITGYPGIAHGGASFAVLDELMGWLVMSHLGRAGFTTFSTVRYFAPLVAGREYLFQAVPDGEADLIEYPRRVSLRGSVIEEGRPNMPLIEMRAEMLLASRRLAERILGRSLDPIVAEMFPED